MTNTYLLWSTQSEAASALDFINGTEWFPLVGKNAATGKPEPNKQQTVRWFEEPLETVSGDWVFPEIPGELLDMLGVPQEEVDGFFTLFNPATASYDPNWFPEEE